jgi:hypothetical protein
MIGTSPCCHGSGAKVAWVRTRRPLADPERQLQLAMLDILPLVGQSSEA